MKLVVGLIGRIASGKSVVADHLVRERKASYYRFSDVLRDLLLRLHKPNTRENLQDMGLALRKVFGDGVLAETLRRDIEEDQSDLIVIDGIRYLDEFNMVRSLDGIIIYVTAPEKVRYERAVGRATRGEAGISLEEFRRSEAKKTERLIDKLGAKADYVIENTGSIEDVKNRVDGILAEKGYVT